MKLVVPGLGRSSVEEFELVVLLPLEQRHFQLELAVEMVLDDALVAAGDEDEMLDAGLARLVDDVLDQRPVDHRQHLLRHGLGGRQEPGAEAGDGENGFADGFHAVPLRSGSDGKTWSGRLVGMQSAFLPQVLVQVKHDASVSAQCSVELNRISLPF